MTGMSGENFLMYLKEVQAVGHIQSNMLHLVNQAVDNLPEKGKPGQSVEGSMNIMIQVLDLRIPISEDKKRYWEISINYKCSLPPAYLPQVRKIDIVITWANEFTREEWDARRDDDLSNDLVREAYKIINGTAS